MTLTLEDTAAARADLTPEYLAGMCGMACYEPDDGGNDCDGDSGNGLQADQYIPTMSDLESAWQSGWARGRNGDPLGVLPAHPTLADFCADGHACGAEDLARVEAEAMADPSAWLTLPQRDVLDAFETLPGCRFDAGRCSLWVPLVPTMVDFWMTLAGVNVPFAAMFETALERGSWIDLNRLGA